SSRKRCGESCSLQQIVQFWERKKRKPDGTNSREQRGCYISMTSCWAKPASQETQSEDGYYHIKAVTFFYVENKALLCELVEVCQELRKTVQ
ncbi:hypothetical protein NPIL_437441, partial [Nephila pilipes]